MFARRTSWPTTPNVLHTRWLDVCAQNCKTYDLTPSNPTAVGFAPDLAALTFADSTACIYKPEALGLLSARRALLDHFSLDLPPDHCCLTASTSEAYGFLLALLCDPGSAVLTPTPGYPLLHHLCEFHDVTRVDYPLRYDGSWQLDLHGLQSALALAPDPRAIVAISPNNPTGHSLDPDELHALEDLCTTNDLALIVDEVFSGYTLKTGQRTVAQPLATPRCLTFALGGLSKYAALPQVKLSWMLAAGPHATVTAAMERLEVIADTYLNLAGPVQVALAELLASAGPTRTAICQRIQANQHLIIDMCTRRESAVTPLHTTHGWTQLIRLPAVGLDDQDWALELIEAGVRTQPGYLFDMPPRLGPVLALSLLTEPDVFAPGVTRLLDGVKTRVSTPLA